MGLKAGSIEGLSVSDRLALWRLQVDLGFNHIKQVNRMGLKADPVEVLSVCDALTFLCWVSVYLLHLSLL